MVTTSTIILAFKWPSALTPQLVVSIRHIEDPAPHGLGGARVPLAESKHKRTRSTSCLTGSFDVHGEGDSERLDLVMINPTTNSTSCFCGNPQQLNFFISSDRVRNWVSNPICPCHPTNPAHTNTAASTSGDPSRQ